MINIADLLMENNTASERPNNDNPIVDYSDNHEKIDNDTPIEDEVLDESYVFSKEDLYINFEKFESGKSNVCLITGLSGSGKTTLSEQIAKKYNAELIELDIFEHCYGFSDDNLARAGQVFYDYLSAHKDIWDKLKKKAIKGKELGKEIDKFVHYCISWCKKDKSKKYVIEGVQIYSFMTYKEVKSFPLIIKNTSMIKSIIQRWKRNGDGKVDLIAELKDEFPQLVKWYIDEEKSLNNFKKAVCESFIIDKDKLDELSFCDIDRVYGNTLLNEDNSYSPYNYYSCSLNDWKSKVEREFISTWKNAISKVKSYAKTLPEGTLEFPEEEEMSYLIDHMKNYKGGPNDRASGICIKSLFICDIVKSNVFNNKKIKQKIEDCVKSCIPVKYTEKGKGDFRNIEFKPLVRGDRIIIIADSVVMVPKTKSFKENNSSSENLHPVFIVTSYTDTKFGKIIRKASDCYYTHAAISFESDLHEMYSFGNSGTLSNSKLGGMTCESLNDYIKTSKNAVILVSVVFVKEKDYKKLLAFFDEYLNNSRNTRYNYSNLFNVLKNKPISNTPSLSYICSQFVDSLFKFISIDMTDKPSNLVTPEDIANLHNVKPTVYKLFEGKAIDYNVNRIEKILDKMYSKAKPIKEVTLLEAKEFPIQFNDEGDLLISKKEKIDFLAEYNKSKKLRQSYVKYKNLEGLKYECCKMWYINTILMKLLDNKNLSHSDREDYNNYRSKILTEFSQYLKEIQKIDKSFNFGSFYETTPFSNTKIKINGSTIKYTTKLMKFIFK